MMKRIAPYTSLNTESYYGNGFTVELRAPEPGNIYLETGNHCVLDGRYVFETGTGRIRIGDRVHILVDGHIRMSGGPELIREIEESGFARFEENSHE